MDKLYEINFYYVKSDFCHIVNSLAKKLRDKKVLVNLSNELEMNFLDKYLWTKEKNEFLPHKTFTEKLNIRDNLVLFHGDYLKINNLLNFDIILVSPKVKIKKISNLKKFFFFSYDEVNEQIISTISTKLKNKIKKIKCFYEFDKFKWKTIQIT
jgi:DNA polymerase IIIc chi subunit